MLKSFYNLCKNKQASAVALNEVITFMQYASFSRKDLVLVTFGHLFTLQLKALFANSS